MKFFVLLLSLCITLVSYAAEKGMMSPKSDLRTTQVDIQNTLGSLPSFMKMYPEEGLPGAWEEYKSVFINPNTALSGKLKQLIVVGLAGQIPSNECSYMGIQFARMDGASEADIRDAVAMAAATRHWSTHLNGIQYNEAEFAKETSNIVSFLKKSGSTAAGKADMPEEKTIEVTDAQTAYQDIKRTLGSVPQFFRQLPEASVAGAWKMMKTYQMNPDTSLSPKEKELIGVAVSAQIPCQYCIHFHTEAAKLNGSTDREIHEAITVASLTRQWSTVLHGNMIDERKFRGEIDQMVRYIKMKHAKDVGLKSNHQKKKKGV